MNWDESGQCGKIKQSSDEVWQYLIALQQISSTNWVITKDCKVHYRMCRYTTDDALWVEVLDSQ